MAVAVSLYTPAVHLFVGEVDPVHMVSRLLLKKRAAGAAGEGQSNLKVPTLHSIRYSFLSSGGRRVNA